MITIYQYSKCSTCKKALKFLDEHGVEYTAVDIVEKPPTQKELSSMLKFQGDSIRSMFNTSGQVYREMDLKNKIGNMKKTEAIRLLSKNGKLIKRPFLLAGKNGFIGFNKDEWNLLT